MRLLKFLPLTYLCGVEGFDLFAPYLALAVTASHVVWAVRRRRELRGVVAPDASIPPADAVPAWG